jgi:hypothetical protein
MNNKKYYQDLFESGTGDVCVTINDNTLMLHSALLNQVPIFKSSLNNQKKLDLSEYDGTSIREFLKFLYTHEIPEDMSTRINDYYYLKVFCMEDELKEFLQHIKSMCNDDTVADIINLSEKLEIDDILNYCIDYIANNIRKHSIPCFDSYKAETISLGIVKDRRYGMPCCCEHYKVKTEDDAKHIIKIHERETNKLCIYHTLVHIYEPNKNNDLLDNNPEEEIIMSPNCVTDLCCKHRRKYSPEFINKISNKMKDKIMEKLILF